MASKNKDSNLFLVNLFSMQFPHPYSKTPGNFQIYFGRLIVKLLLDNRINNKLYIDECIWFLPFIQKISLESYEKLISDILDYRKKSYKDKYILFRRTWDFEDVFANVTHEMNYYFLRIFQQFGVFDIIEDKNHNEGNLFKFKHGTGQTYRNDAFKTRGNSSGFVQLNKDIKEDAYELVSEFSPFEVPYKQSDFLSVDEWIRDLYEFAPLKYINHISDNKNSNYQEIISSMIHESKFGTKDGKSFEIALRDFAWLFRETRNVEIISGSGDTDILCVMENANSELYKINLEAKTSRNRVPALYTNRIVNHVLKNNSDYCIVVSSAFSKGIFGDKGIAGDISNTKIVAIEAETFANYCLKECIYSSDSLANFDDIDEIIRNCLGKNITKYVNNLIQVKYSINLG